MKLEKLGSQYTLGSESNLYRKVIKPMAISSDIMCVRVENPVYPGTPDCWVCDKGNSYWIELKSRKGKLSEDQCDFIVEAHKNKGRVYVVQGAMSYDNIWQLKVSIYFGRTEGMGAVTTVTTDISFNLFDFLV